METCSEKRWRNVQRAQHEVITRDGKTIEARKQADREGEEKEEQTAQKVSAEGGGREAAWATTKLTDVR